MIIEPTQITEYGVTFNELIYVSDFWACGYILGSTQILLITSETEPMPAGSKIYSLLTGFASDSYEGLLAEIANRGLILNA